ncbi:unnamed protein product, partial [marine sediment metagenome]
MVRKGGIVQFERYFQLLEPPTVEIYAVVSEDLHGVSVSLY